MDQWHNDYNMIWSEMHYKDHNTNPSNNLFFYILEQN